MADILFSLVICTCNPRLDYLGRVLDALGTQTFPRDRWDLVIIDNRSEPPLAARIAPAHSIAYRIVREETPGLVAARCRGSVETYGEWLVYVDDDNLIQRDYLEKLHQLITSHPHVAVWSPEIHPEFEIQPSIQTKPFWEYLAIRKINGTQWSNIEHNAPLPCGAGMAVRRDVMEHWVEGMKTDVTRSQLGRTENSLLAGEDTDIGLAAIDLGLGVGVSDAIQVIHLIAARRLNEQYLRKIAYSVVYSHTLLDLLRQSNYSRAIILRILVFTRKLLAHNRNRMGIALWWSQLVGVLSAWRHFKSKVNRNGA